MEDRELLLKSDPEFDRLACLYGVGYRGFGTKNRYIAV